MDKARQDGVGQGSVQGSGMRGVLLVPSSSPTLPPICDGLDVSMTSNITWFHLNHDMVSRRLYQLSFRGGRSSPPDLHIHHPTIRRPEFKAVGDT